MLLLQLVILAQTVTPGPGARTAVVDPGNDPIFTAIFYLIFSAILIGSGVAGFKFRQWRMRREKKD